MLAETLSLGQKSGVTTPQSALDDLLFVASRNQCVWALRTHIALSLAYTYFSSLFRTRFFWRMC